MIKDPAEIWDDYCEEVAPGDRSQQGAMAFAVESVSATVERAIGQHDEILTLRAQLASVRSALGSIAGFGDINLSGEWESSLRGIIRSMTDCAKDALSDEQRTSK